MTAADRLHQATALLREHAKAAPPGRPWWTVINAPHPAAMHAEVGLAVADLLTILPPSDRAPNLAAPEVEQVIERFVQRVVDALLGPEKEDQ